MEYCFRVRLQKSSSTSAVCCDFFAEKQASLPAYYCCRYIPATQFTHLPVAGLEDESRPWQILINRVVSATFVAFAGELVNFSNWRTFAFAPANRIFTIPAGTSCIPIETYNLRSLSIRFAEHLNMSKFATNFQKTFRFCVIEETFPNWRHISSTWAAPAGIAFLHKLAYTSLYNLLLGRKCLSFLFGFTIFSLCQRNCALFS